MISASHNPYHDNGIKIFDPSGSKLDNLTEAKIEADIAEDKLTGPLLGEGSVLNDEEIQRELGQSYLDYLQHRVAEDLSLDGFTIVLDCANGAASGLAPELFTRLGARVVPINNQPDGRNINFKCGSLHIEGLQERVLTERADLGVAFDGDADRALFVDAAGTFVDGDATMWVLANYLSSRGELDGQMVVSTVMTNLGLEIALAFAGHQTGANGRGRQVCPRRVAAIQSGAWW